MIVWQNPILSIIKRIRYRRPLLGDGQRRPLNRVLRSLWIADVQLEEVPAGSDATQRRYTEVVPSIESNNLIPNGSFECGTSGWGSIGRGVDWGDGGLVTLVGRTDGQVSADGASAAVTALMIRQSEGLYALAAARRCWSRGTPLP